MIAIIDYGAGNIRSVQNAFARLNVETVITGDAETIRAADRVIFPGVGHAKAAMQLIREQNLDETIPNLRQPVLGICLGMQLLCEWTEEGDTAGLGIFSTRVRKFGSDLRIPHMGWNNVIDAKGKLFENIEPSADFYFVHSYAVEIDAHTVATSEMGYPFAAAVEKGNFYGVQFHPEKSGSAGQQLLKNFLKV